MSRDAGRITLFRTATGWSARFTGDAATMVQKLFKTDVLPMAFSRNAKPEDVKAQAERGWPLCVVNFEEDQ